VRHWIIHLLAEQDRREEALAEAETLIAMTVGFGEDAGDFAPAARSLLHDIRERRIPCGDDGSLPS
jgi:hypothetical protein